jgi:hypothetical protein
MQVLIEKNSKDIQKDLSNTQKECQIDIYKCPQPCLSLKRQTHMHCIVCYYIAEFYDQNLCHNCGNLYKWSIPWKNKDY